MWEQEGIRYQMCVPSTGGDGYPRAQRGLSLTTRLSRRSMSPRGPSGRLPHKASCPLAALSRPQVTWPWGGEGFISANRSPTTKDHAFPWMRSVCVVLHLHQVTRETEDLVSTGGPGANSPWGPRDNCLHTHVHTCARTHMHNLVRRGIVPLVLCRCVTFHHSRYILHTIRALLCHVT